MPNSKLPRHRKPRRGDHRHDERVVPFLADNPNDVGSDLGDLVRRAEELEEEPDSRDKEKRKEALANIIQKIAAYHILPESYETADLIQNSTYATNLTLNDGSMDRKPLRLSILSTSIPPRLRINIFVKVTKRDIKAKNGERNFWHFLFSHLGFCARRYLPNQPTPVTPSIDLSRDFLRARGLLFLREDLV